MSEYKRASEDRLPRRGGEQKHCCKRVPCTEVLTVGDEERERVLLSLYSTYVAVWELKNSERSATVVRLRGRKDLREEFQDAL